MDKEFTFCRSPTTTAIGDFLLKKKAYLFSVKTWGLCASLRTDGAPAVLEHARAKEILCCLQYGESWLRGLSEEVVIVVEVITQAVYFIGARSFNNNLSSQICSYRFR
jgi:hypothetical protein